MSELIAGWQAIKAVEDGELVEYQKMSSKWYSLNDEKGKWIVGDFTRGSYKFRLKPRTITINGIEIPACGENYKYGDFMYILNSLNPGEYDAVILDDNDDVPAYWWRTEEEIRQVVAALRKLFKGATQ